MKPPNCPRPILKNVSIDQDGQIIFDSRDDRLKLFQIPIPAKEDKSYLIRFNIKKEVDLDDFLTVDLYGVHYDHPEQKSRIYNTDIADHFTITQTMISTEGMPPGQDMVLRF